MDLQVFCPTCKTIVQGSITGDASVQDPGCDSCGYGQDIAVTIEIRCATCKGLVYEQDGIAHP